MARIIAFLFLFFFFFFFSALVVAEERQSAARQCRLQRFSTAKPCCSFKSEGGMIDIWDENQDQCQCAGIFAMRTTIHSESMGLPNYSPSPRLAYIQKGRGLIGISYPGCPETFHSSRDEKSEKGDQHQKIHRIQEGDVVAIPSGAVHWSYNDGNEELVVFAVADVQSESNQLDQTARAFFLAGGQPKGSGSEECEKGREISRMASIFKGMDARMMADALGVPVEVAEKMKREDERGFIVKVSKRSMSVIRPTEMEERRGVNGLEELYCSMKIRHYLDDPMEADVYSKQGGRLNSVNMLKLPILRYIGMSAEKGNLKSNVMFGPHWSINAHTVVYVTRGEGRTQIVSDEGKTVFDENVKMGDVFVIPQYFASIHKTSENGIEWVAMKTSSAPMRSPIVGHASVFKGMPVGVLANAFRITESRAMELKCNREDQMMMFSPRRTSPRIY